MTAVDTRPDPGKHKLNFVRMLRSEWIKSFSLRSTWWLLIVAIVINVGIAMIVAFSMRYAMTQPMGPGDHPSLSDMGGRISWTEYVAQICGMFGELIFIIMSILIITNEFSSGMIRSTMGVAPRRGRVLLSKMFVVAILSLIIFGISVAASYYGGYMVFKGVKGVDLTLTSTTSLRILGGFMAVMLLMGWFSFGLGAWIRSTAGAIGAALGVVLVLPMVVTLIANLASVTPESTGWRKLVFQGQWFLPSNAGSLVTTKDLPPGCPLTEWGGLAVLGGWALLAVIIGFVATSSRDV